MSGTKTMTCIECPRGCRLDVVVDGSKASVSGHLCARGEEWGRQEAVEPLRTLTSTVAVDAGVRRRVPVRSSGDLPLSRLQDAMSELDCILLRAPVRHGDMVVANILGLGADMVATDDVPSAQAFLGEVDDVH